MYFLRQIQHQFFAQIALYEERVGESGGAGVADTVDETEFLSVAEKAL